MSDTELTNRWYTEPEAADFLKVTEKALKNARYRKKVKSVKVCGVVQYREDWLEELREAPCEEHQSSASGQAPPSGTSHSPRDADQSALARARAIVYKLSESSRNSSSKGGRPRH